LFHPFPATSRTLNQPIFLAEAVLTPDGRAGFGQMDCPIPAAATAGLVFAALVIFIRWQVRRPFQREDFTLCLFLRQLVFCAFGIFSV
jgi:hypothetical protein